MSLADRMYHVLETMPCRCERKWDKEQECGYVITKKCSRCIVMHEYLEARAELEKQSE